MSWHGNDDDKLRGRNEGPFIMVWVIIIFCLAMVVLALAYHPHLDIWKCQYFGIGCEKLFKWD